MSFKKDITYVRKAATILYRGKIVGKDNDCVTKRDASVCTRSIYDIYIYFFFFDSLKFLLFDTFVNYSTDQREYNRS